MNSFLIEYIPIIIILGLAVCMACLIMLATWLVAKRYPDENKLAPYECGFDAFEDTRSQFDVRFYLVAILFIIFDLEVAFLFPWAISLGNIGLYGFISMMIFLMINSLYYLS